MVLLVAHTKFIHINSQISAYFHTPNVNQINFFTIQNNVNEIGCEQMPIKLGLNFFLSIFQYTFRNLSHYYQHSSRWCLCIWMYSLLCPIQHADQRSNTDTWTIARNTDSNKNTQQTVPNAKCLPCIWSIEFIRIASGVMMCACVCVIWNCTKM